MENYCPLNQSIEGTPNHPKLEHFGIERFESYGDLGIPNFQTPQDVEGDLKM